MSKARHAYLLKVDFKTSAGSKYDFSSAALSRLISPQLETTGGFFHLNIQRFAINEIFQALRVVVKSLLMAGQDIFSTSDAQTCSC